MAFEYPLLALRNIRKRGLRSALTLLGIVIGITAVVALIALGQGLEQAITGQFSSLSADRLVVTNAETGFGPPGSTAVKKLTSHDLSVIERVPNVMQAIPRLIRVVRAEYNKVGRTEFIGSLPPKQEDLEYFYESFQMEAASGRLPNAGDRGEILIGSSVTESERYGKEIRVGTNIVLQGKEFKVAGILKPLSSFQFNDAIFMVQEDMEDILNIEDEIDIILVRVREGEDPEGLAEEITRKMRRDRGLKEGEEDFSVQTPLKVLGTVTTILTGVQAVVAGIATIALIVGIVGVANTLFTSVVERTREIGIMKAIGSKQRNIAFIFISEAAMLGLLGGLLGITGGIALALVAAKAANTVLNTSLFSVDFDPVFLLFTLASSLIIGVLAGAVPTLQAARLHPVEALRK